MTAPPLAQFNASIAQWLPQLDQHLDKLVQGVAFEIAENVIVGGEFAPGTPIDTGFARGSWWVSLNDFGSPHQPGDNQGVVGQAVLSAITGAKAGDLVYFLSNTVYMPALEFGHSGQAPEGMIRLTVAAGQRIVDKVAMQMGATL